MPAQLLHLLWGMPLTGYLNDGTITKNSSCHLLGICYVLGSIYIISSSQPMKVKKLRHEKVKSYK